MQQQVDHLTNFDLAEKARLLARQDAEIRELRAALATGNAGTFPSKGAEKKVPDDRRAQTETPKELGVFSDVDTVFFYG